MSHQSGIQASDELKRFLATSKGATTRLIKISIRDEKLVLSDQKPAKKNWEHDYKTFAVPSVEEHVPCFLLFRLDTSTNLGSDWLFITYSPDTANVRQKMLYASTRATLKAEIGIGQIREEMHASSIEDLSLDGYLRFKRSKATPGPMTEVEQELQQVNKSIHINVNTVSQTLAGVAFPIDGNAVEKLHAMRDGSINYVQLSVDTLNEAIKLEEAESLRVSDLRAHIPRAHPRYHFFVFNHQYEGDNYNSCVFIYSMPARDCSIKERMLYSSCKNMFLDTVQKYVGINVDRKIETDCTEEVNEAFLLDHLHPKLHLHQPAFAKPPGPKRAPRSSARP